MTNENTVHKSFLLSARKFSQMTGVSRSTLVYYDKEGILKPAMRDKFTNYRYYDPQQVITLSFIRQCLFWGIPLSEIKSYYLRGHLPISSSSFRSSIRFWLTAKNNHGAIVCSFNIWKPDWYGASGKWTYDQYSRDEPVKYTIRWGKQLSW